MEHWREIGQVNIIFNILKGVLLGLKQFLATESPSKMIKDAL